MSLQATFGHSRRGDSGEHWLSVSDLMSGLMILFLFIAVTYMRFVQIERDRIKEVVVLADETYRAIYSDLNSEFADDLSRWNAELEQETLTVRFRNPDVLFDQNSAEIKPGYQQVLVDFFPRYVHILSKYKETIAEVRIEGHTSSEWRSEVSATEAYFLNMELSQRRTRSVMEYCYTMAGIAEHLPWLKGKLAAVGLSSARPILATDNKSEDSVKSRRVEFRVVTNFERKIITQILDRPRR